MASFAYFSSLCLLLFCASTTFALFETSSGPQRALSVQEGTDVYVALNNLLANFNGFDASKWYDSGFAFANVQIINGKRVAIRYVRFTQYCTVGPWESAIGSLVLEDFRTTVTYLRPYLLQGCTWAAVSNGYAWVDYYLLDKDEAMIILPSSTSMPELMSIPFNVSSKSNLNTNDNRITASTSIADDDEATAAAEHSRILLSMVSRYSPVEKTGFLHCPVFPLGLLSHNNGIWDVLKAGEFLTSANKRILLAMQRDCNLVLTDTQENRVLWSSSTARRGNACFLRLQSDANLVIYKENNIPVWAINQGCGRGCVKFSALVVEDNGNMVVYRSQNSKLNKMWSTGTKVV